MSALDERRDMDKRVEMMAHKLSLKSQFDRERIALCRTDPEKPSMGAVVAMRKLLAEMGIDAENNTEFCRWIFLGHCLALARGRHSPKARTGEILAGIWYSGARLSRLISEDQKELLSALPELARLFNARHLTVDWRPLGILALYTGINDERAGQARLEISRSFVSAQYNAKPTP